MDWAALPLLRSAAHNWLAEHTMATTVRFLGKTDLVATQKIEGQLQAMKNLYHHLWNGHYGKGLARVCIAGDTTKLHLANGLSPLEKKLALEQNYLAKNFPGTQQVRRLMYHRQFGARVCYGDCLFFRISPNEQNSALVLHLSIFRANDPYCLHADRDTRRLAKNDYPNLEARRSRPSHGTREKMSNAWESVDIELPAYEQRRVATARNPRAVIEAYRVEIYLRLAHVFGVRMCPQCPRCNSTGRGCQDRFGSNRRPVGGSCGGMNALGGATEFQKYGTPHFHGEGHIVCLYQFYTLQDIVRQIQSDVTFST